MDTLLSLWLPVLLSAVAVFVISSVVHMVIKWHSSDYLGLPNEDAVRAAIRAGNPVPGRYMFPHCEEMKEMQSEAMQQKYREGPVGHVTLGPAGMPNIGKFLGLWFVQNIVIAVVVAFLVAKLIPHDAVHARLAAKLAGAVTFVAYGFGTITESVWAMRPWKSSAKFVLDAVLYGLGAGAVYLWLWN